MNITNSKLKNTWRRIMITQWLVLLLPLVALMWSARQIGAQIELRPATFPSYRLNKNVVPDRYEVDVKFNLQENPLSKAQISVSIVDTIFRWEEDEEIMSIPTLPHILEFSGQSNKEEMKYNYYKNLILMHVDKSVKVHSIKYDQTEGTEACTPQIDHYLFDEEKQLLGIVFVKDLEIGSRGILTIEFAPPVRTDSRGLHYIEQSTIDEGDEMEYHIYLTKFQPSDARLFFPCFDEPQFKAKFQLAIVYNVKFDALSNTKGKSSNREPNKRVTKFEETEKIPIHMFAFALGDFNCKVKRKIGGQNKVIGACTTPRSQAKAEFMLDVAAQAVEFIEQYTDSIFPPGKLEILCVLNHDKDNTENWGLAMIESRYCLIDDGTRASTMILVAINAAHVVAHQWYGNLVTAKWWDSLWVTEGAAALLAFKTVKRMYPSLNSDYFVRFNMLSDSIVADNTIVPRHNLARSIEDPSIVGDVNESFDSSEFTKSGSLFKLIENTIGEENLKLALRRLIVPMYQFGSVDKDDLASVLASVSQQKFDLSLFNYQIRHGRAPQLYFSLSETGDKPQLKCEQGEITARYLNATLHFYEYDGDVRSRHDSHHVDLESAVNSYPEWFDFSNKNHYLMIDPIPDVSQNYHINIDKSLDQNFKRLITEKCTDAMGRANLLEHAIRGYRMRGPDYTENLEKWLGFYENEDEPLVMMRIFEAMKLLAAQERHSDVLRLFNAKIENQYVHGLVFSGRNIPITFKQISRRKFIREQEEADAITLLVMSDNSLVTLQARDYFLEANGRIPPVHLRAPVYMAVEKYGEEREVRLLVDNLLTTNSLEERILLVALLATHKRFNFDDVRLKKFCSSKKKLLPIDVVELARNMCDTLLSLKRKSPHDDPESSDLWSDDFVRSLLDY